uniref:Uncharacterized protein n=1 Tax=Anopheles atroparvus TaxID=41427 RepID=A0AAG5DM25_ANOAO
RRQSTRRGRENSDDLQAPEGPAVPTSRLYWNEPETLSRMIKTV